MVWFLLPPPPPPPPPQPLRLIAANAATSRPAYTYARRRVGGLHCRPSAKISTLSSASTSGMKGVMRNRRSALGGYNPESAVESVAWHPAPVLLAPLTGV